MKRALEIGLYFATLLGAFRIGCYVEHRLVDRWYAEHPQHIVMDVGATLLGKVKQNDPVPFVWVRPGQIFTIPPGSMVAVEQDTYGNFMIQQLTEKKHP